MTDDEPFDPGEEVDGHSLVMPFIVCPDPYDDAAFVAGMYFGELAVLIKTLSHGPLIRRFVPSGLVPQIELLVMSEGVHGFKAEPWAEHPDEWTYIEISQGPLE